eukprot:TRINITY_DN3521_c0_g1_i1.p1 TRINITY_DN3521_c0_g1~~TRINITY_DN3521_c0_g1_i1.p1  ORF type:complete len:303 (-),score=21.37 TRINITY_DN3521_c0_g1_i1:117-1025(-)
MWATPRPISNIRSMAEFGQSSFPETEPYDEKGLILVPGLIELVTEESVAVGGTHEGLGLQNVGEIAIRAWRGPPRFPERQYSGVGWILAKTWLPYVFTPSFPGYTSGHSNFCGAFATVMTHFTGSPYFPGGLAQKTIEPGYLQVEYGPSQTTVLEWATFRDAGDQCGLSRLYGGVHSPQDDLNGRQTGIRTGELSWETALQYWGVDSTCSQFSNFTVGGITLRLATALYTFEEAVATCQECFNTGLANLSAEMLLAIPSMNPTEVWIGSYNGSPTSYMAFMISEQVSVTVRQPDSTLGVLCQ